MSRPFALSLALLTTLSLAAALSPAEDVRIEIDPGQKFQRIEGFGTCLYPHSAATRETYQSPGFDKTYAETLGLNIIRINLEHFPCDPFDDPAKVTADLIKPDPRRGPVYTDFAKKVRKLNPNVRIIATAWTPPAWMKANNNNASGRPRGQNAAILASSYTLTRNRGISKNHVARDKYPHFVAWMTALADYFQREGIPLYAMSPANEPRFSQWYGSCVWTARDYATIIAMLGEGLEKAGHGDILLYGPEDMTGHLHDEGTSAFVNAIVANPRARAQLDRFATHGYTDGIEADMSQTSSAKFWASIEKFDKPYWMTEGGTGPHDWPKPITGGAGLAIHNSLVAGHASAFVPWQIAGGEASGHNFMLRDQMTPKTRALLHFSRTVPTDSHRIAAEPAYGEVLASAYLRAEDGKLGIVLINPTNQTHTATLDLTRLGKLARLELYRTTDGRSVDAEGNQPIRDGLLRLPMPAESIASLRGQLGR